MVSDFESTLQKDSHSKSLVRGGGVHPMTLDAMNYLSNLSDDEDPNLKNPNFIEEIGEKKPNLTPKLRKLPRSAKRSPNPRHPTPRLSSSPNPKYANLLLIGCLVFLV
jgi:hypothetical protein